MLGGLFMAAGNMLLAHPSVAALYAGLVLLVIGNGFFKPNVSAIVGNLYPTGSPLKDSAYNIFYMGINIGAFLAPITAEVILQSLAGSAVLDAAKQGNVLSAADALALRNGFLFSFWVAPAGMTPGTLI